MGKNMKTGKSRLYQMFYDIHFHVLNLSHINILSYISHFNIFSFLSSRIKRHFLVKILWGILSDFLFKRKEKNHAANILSFLSNDIGNMFLQLEYFLKYGKPSLYNRGIKIGRQYFDKIILIPLLIDFNCRFNYKKKYFYMAGNKPIEEQIHDLFNGIIKYRKFELTINNNGEFKIMPRYKNEPLFEIYPFLGIDPNNYKDEKEVKLILKTYFNGYNAGKYKETFYKFIRKSIHCGSLQKITNNLFAGIKLYPPTGFDPWPEKDKDENKLKKVKVLYRFCCRKNIPVTTHCQDTSIDFVPYEKKTCSPFAWEKILSYKENGKEVFKKLKVNLAHLGWQDNNKREWVKKIMELINRYPNVYTDIAFWALDLKYYDNLCKLIKEYEKKYTDAKFDKRILFGSDFFMSLIGKYSYNCYLETFSRFGENNKKLMMKLCRDNPEKFLFG